MKRNFTNNDIKFSESEWFIAEITGISSEDINWSPLMWSSGDDDILKWSADDAEDWIVIGSVETCYGIPHDWKQVDYCNTGDGVENLGEPDLSGIGNAYAMNDLQAAIGDVVLMRFRGSFEGKPVYEFLNKGVAYGNFNCYMVTDLECIDGILHVENSNKCGGYA